MEGNWFFNSGMTGQTSSFEHTVVPHTEPTADDKTTFEFPFQDVMTPHLQRLYLFVVVPSIFFVSTVLLSLIFNFPYCFRHLLHIKVYIYRIKVRFWSKSPLLFSLTPFSISFLYFLETVPQRIYGTLFFFFFLFLLHLHLLVSELPRNKEDETALPFSILAPFRS